MDYEQIAVQREGAVAWVTLNRPERLNALTSRMASELIDAFGGMGADPEVRCVVIIGEGRGFCAGQDLTEFEAEYRSGKPRDVITHLRTGYHALIPMIVETPKPVIAAVNGVAAGAGVSVALACDIRIASDEARFVQAFVKIGLVPDSGGTFLLPRAVGTAKALELSMTGDLIDAKTALEIGLVSRVVSAASFRDEVAALADRFAAMPTLALARTKRLIHDAANLDLRAALDREAETQQELVTTHDHTEGVFAFVEKREPTFEGR